MMQQTKIFKKQNKKIVSSFQLYLYYQCFHIYPKMQKALLSRKEALWSWKRGAGLWDGINVLKAWQFIKIGERYYISGII